jgi:hypothetical protein
MLGRSRRTQNAMSALVTTVIAAVSASAAVGTLVAYLYFVRRSEISTAREEALALAETRGEVIAELRVRVEGLEQRRKRMKADCDRRMNRLQRALEHDRAAARERADQTQRLHAAALTELLEGLRADLEAVPPDHDAVLARIRQLLARPPAAVP